MPIPTSKAYRTEYCDEVMRCLGSQMYGYRRSAGPSVASMAAQAAWTIKASSHCIQLRGSRSIRAAISPGITKVVASPPVAAPEVSCAIAVLLAAIRCHGNGGSKAGNGGALTADAGGVRVAADGDAGHHARADT